MDKGAVWISLAADIRVATAALDWPALAALDQAVAGQLREIASGDRMSAAEDAALALLRRAHTEALAVCRHEAAELGSRMEALRDCKDGWQAYAASSEIEEGQQ